MEPRAPRRSEMAGPEPALPEAVSAQQLSRDVRAELRALSKTSADIVARRLVASGELLNVDPELSLRHALAARKVASRIAAVREAVGLAAYRCEQWQLAMSELRAFQRMTGRGTHLAVLADCERGLGRPERAVDLFRHTDRKQVAAAEWIELLIVAAGARRDMGQVAASVTMLQIPALQANGAEEWRLRLRYAYADALEAAGRVEEAYTWFARAVELDPQGLTDAVDRLLALEGVAIEGDELPDDDEDAEWDELPEESPDGTGDARPGRPPRTGPDDVPADPDASTAAEPDTGTDEAGATRRNHDAEPEPSGARRDGGTDEAGVRPDDGPAEPGPDATRRNDDAEPEPSGARRDGGTDEAGARRDGGTDEAGVRRDDGTDEAGIARRDDGGLA